MFWRYTERPVRERRLGGGEFGGSEGFSAVFGDDAEITVEDGRCGYKFGIGYGFANVGIEEWSGVSGWSGG